MNLLIVLVDDLGAELFSVYGRGGAGTYDYPATTWVTALANGGTVSGVTYAQGLRFNRNYVEQLCSPTRSTLLTGRYPFRHGVGDIIRNDGGGATTQQPLLYSETTLADALRDAGYRTGQFGKWHMANTNGGDAYRHGFDTTCTLRFNLDNSVTYSVNGKSVREGYYAWTEEIGGEARETFTNRTYCTTALVNQAARWIRDQGSNPWFCYLPLFAVHAPFVNRTNLSPNAINSPPTSLYDTSKWTAGADADQTSTTQSMHALRAGVEATDREIARLISTIPASVLANTLIVFTSDNGSSSSTLAFEQHPTLGLYPAAHAKDSPYEPAIQTPLVINGPGVTGGVYDGLFNVADLFPTLYQHVTGGVINDGVTRDGISFEPVLAGSSAALRTESYSEWFQPNGNYEGVGDTGKTAFEWAMVGPRYKLLRNGSSATYEFYDLLPSGTYNPMEATNLTPGGSTATLTAPQLAEFNRLLAARTELVTA